MRSSRSDIEFSPARDMNESTNAAGEIVRLLFGCVK
jgi:hypothetical protein